MKIKALLCQSSAVASMAIDSYFFKFTLLMALFLEIHCLNTAHCMLLPSAKKACVSLCKCKCKRSQVNHVHIHYMTEKQYQEAFLDLTLNKGNAVCWSCMLQLSHSNLQLDTQVIGSRGAAQSEIHTVFKKSYMSWDQWLWSNFIFVSICLT